MGEGLLDLGGELGGGLSEAEEPGVAGGDDGLGARGWRGGIGLAGVAARGERRARGEWWARGGQAAGLPAQGQAVEPLEHAAEAGVDEAQQGTKQAVGGGVGSHGFADAADGGGETLGQGGWK